MLQAYEGYIEKGRVYPILPLSDIEGRRKVIITVLDEPPPTNAELLLAAIERKGIPHKTVEVNAEGHIIVDKDKDPELYKWAVEG